MNDNIDLTENRDFQKRGIPSSILSKNRDRKLNNSIFKGNLDIKLCIEIDTENEHGAFTQGDRDRRKFYKEVCNFGCYCERCGRNNKFPWDKFETGLCPQCDEEMDIEVNRLWRS